MHIHNNFYIFHNILVYIDLQNYKFLKKLVFFLRYTSHNGINKNYKHFKKEFKKLHNQGFKSEYAVQTKMFLNKIQTWSKMHIEPYNQMQLMNY